MGFNAWNTFVLRVEHPYIVRNLEKSLDMVSSPSMPRKLHVADCSRKSKYMFSFSAANYSLELHKKHSKAAVHGIRRFHKAYIIRYLSARIIKDTSYLWEGLAHMIRMERANFVELIVGRSASCKLI